MRNIYFVSLSIVIILPLIISCKNKKDDLVTPMDNCQSSISASTPVQGYGILNRLPGIWNGPVYSPTPLGSFPEWIVDFRPISAAQIASKCELDSLNDIFMSFFIVKHDCKYKIAFRNGGGFAGQVRNSYMIIDSVYEDANMAFYRFSDPISGGNRVHTNITFKQDSIKMFTYTNHYNTLPQPQLHMQWLSKRQDLTSAQSAISAFNFPSKVMVRDFTTTFDGLTESIFYSSASDPYPENQQPYLGQGQVNVQITAPATPDPSKKVLIFLTTQPLFNGFTFLSGNLIYRSRLVFVGAQAQTGFLFNYLHPGIYYVNAIYDNNGDLNFSSGDYMNSNFDVPMTLAPNGQTSANVVINFQIP